MSEFINLKKASYFPNLPDGIYLFSMGTGTLTGTRTTVALSNPAATAVRVFHTVMMLKE
jgi:hypothetical protein